MIEIGKQNIKLEDFYRIHNYDEKITITSEAVTRINKSFEFLKEFSQDKVIYGINTGFGPMAQYRIVNGNQKQLQYNLIRSHAAGAGDFIPPPEIKTAMVVLASNLSQGYSGIHINVIRLLEEFINRNIIPAVPEHGGVGASGDLVQLAHIALSLIGEGKVFFENGLTDTASVLKTNKLKPIEIHIREGLALMNGTSVMTGIGIVNVLKAKRLLNWALVTSAMINEMVQSFDDHFSFELNRVKHHDGQQVVAERLRFLTGGSKLIKKRENGFYSKKIDQSKIR
ncbi:MAG: aromatic amino acid lyase, partial [Bacteroidetes bacterium]|nr:aromatic amino acid lyase [Bacteroidota bacterium]